MDKAPDAFRTISEVAEAIAIPAHVLRFWETRFPQIKPVKRAGGRRYYRPSDVALVCGIRQLLHIDGLTIRDVQKVLRDQGVRHVAAIGGALPADLDRAAAQALEPVAATEPPPQAQVLPLNGQPRRASPSAPAQGATIQSLFELDAAPPLETAVPSAPTSPRKPRPTVVHPVTADTQQPKLPLLLAEDVPEAPHIWVEVDAAPVFDLIPLPTPLPAITPSLHKLAQMAAQLQPLPASAVGQTSPALRDLHDRLRQLHARMAQATRPQS